MNLVLLGSLTSVMLTMGCPMQNLFVHDESAHPHGKTDNVGSTRSTMMAWVRKIESNLRNSQKAFLGLEANPAAGGDSRATHPKVSTR